MPDQLPIKPKQTRIRISDEMRRCVEIMAHEGLPLHMAAERANIHRDTATRNMRKAHVLELFNQMVRDVRVNASQAAYMRMVHMSTHADSERVRLDATKWIAGVDGIAPVQKVEGRYSHQHTFGGFEYGDLELEDVGVKGD
jgi:hypothetical protein